MATALRLGSATPQAVYQAAFAQHPSPSSTPDHQRACGQLQAKQRRKRHLSQRSDGGVITAPNPVDGDRAWGMLDDHIIWQKVRRSARQLQDGRELVRPSRVVSVGTLRVLRSVMDLAVPLQRKRGGRVSRNRRSRM